MKKVKKIILSLTLATIGLLTIMLAAPAKEAEAAAPSVTADVRFELYSGSEFFKAVTINGHTETVAQFLEYWAIDYAGYLLQINDAIGGDASVLGDALAYYEGEGSAELEWSNPATSGFGANKKLKFPSAGDSTKTAKDYWGFFPSQKLGATLTGDVIEEVFQLSAKTSFEPGEQVVVVTYAKTSGAIQNINVGPYLYSDYVDLGKTIDAVALPHRSSNVNPETSVKTGSNYAIATGGYQMDSPFIQVDPLNTGNVAVSYASFYIHAADSTHSYSASTNYKIDLALNGLEGNTGSNFAAIQLADDTGGMTDGQQDSTGTYLRGTQKTFNISSASSNQIGIKFVSADDSSSVNHSSTKVSESLYKISGFKPGESITVNFEANYSGTITGVTGGVGSYNASTKSISATTASTYGGKKTLTVAMTAQDSTPGNVTIELYNDPALKDIKIEAIRTTLGNALLYETGSAVSLNKLTNTTTSSSTNSAFSSTDLGYTFVYPASASQLKITTTVDSDTTVVVKAGGSSVPGSSPYTFSSGTFTVEVTGLDSTTKTYTFTASSLSDNASIPPTGISIKDASSTSRVATYTAGSGTIAGTFDGTIGTFNSATTFEILTTGTVSGCSIAYKEKSDPSFTPATGGSSGSISITPGDTKTYQVEVTSPFGDKKVYEVVVNAPTPSSDASLSITYNGVAYTPNSTNVITLPAAAYYETKLSYIPDFPTTAGAYIATTSTATSGTNLNRLATYNNLEFSTASVHTGVRYIHVIAQTGSPTVYTINYSRDIPKSSYYVKISIEAPAGKTVDGVNQLVEYTTDDFIMSSSTAGTLAVAGLPYDVGSVVVKVHILSANPNVKVRKTGTGSNLNDGDIIDTVVFNTVVTIADSKSTTFYVLSEEDQTKNAHSTSTTSPFKNSYIINFSRNGADDTDVQASNILVEYYDGTNWYPLTTSRVGTSANFETTQIPVYQYKQIRYTISRGSNLPASTVIYDASNNDITGITQTDTLPTTTATSVPITFKTTTEAGSHNHTINIKRVAPNQIKTLATLDVYDSVNSSPLSKVQSTTIANYYTVSTKASNGPITLDVVASKASPLTKIYISHISSNTTEIDYDLNPNEPFNVPSTYSAPSEYAFIHVFDEVNNSLTYTVEIKADDERSQETEIESITFDKPVVYDGSGSSYVYNKAQNNPATLVVPFTTSTLTATIVLKDSAATLAKPTAGTTGLSNDGIRTYTYQFNLTAGTTNTVYIQCQAEAPTYVGATYTFNIKRRGAETGNKIEGLVIDGTPITLIEGTATPTYFNSNYTLDYHFSDTTKNAATMSIAVSTGATITTTCIDGTIASGANLINTTNMKLTPHGSSQIRINVKSENDVDKGLNGTDYLFTFYVASNEGRIDNIKLKKDSTLAENLEYEVGSGFTYLDGQYTYNPVKVAFSNKTAYVEADLKNADAEVTYTPGTQSLVLNVGSGGNTFKIVSQSELLKLFKAAHGSDGTALPASFNTANSKREITITIERSNPDTNDYLTSMVASIGSVNLSPSFTRENLDYIIENITGSPTLSINAAPESSKARIMFESTTLSAGETLNTSTLLTGISASDKTLIEKIIVKVYSEEQYDNLINSRSAKPREYVIQCSYGPINLDTENGIQMIRAYVEGDPDKTNVLTPTYSQAQGTYTVNVSTAKNVVIEVEPVANTATVVFDGNPASTSGSASTQAVNPGLSGGPVNIQVGCKAQDGTANPTTYNINITFAALSDDATIKSVTVNGEDVPLDASGKYIAYVKYNTPSAAIVVTPNDSTAIVTGDGAKTIDKAVSPFNITVTAQSGRGVPYIVEVVREEEAKLSMLSAIDPKTGTEYIEDFLETKKPYTFTVPYEADTLDVSYTLKALDPTQMKVTIDGYVTVGGTYNMPVSIGTKKYEVKVETLHGTDSYIYELNITRTPGADGCEILTYQLVKGDETTNVTDWNSTSPSYTYFFDAEKYPSATFNPGYTVSTNAKHSIRESDLVLRLGQVNTYHIDLESQTGIPRAYEINVYYARNNFDIDNIRVLTADQSGNLVDVTGKVLEYDKTTSEYNLEVAYTDKQMYLEVTPADSAAKVYLDGTVFTNPIKNLYEGPNKFVVTAKSQLASLGYSAITVQSQPYTINITRNPADTDNTLKNLHVIISGSDANADAHDVTGVLLNPENLSYTFENIGEVTSIRIEAEANSKLAKVEGGTYQYTSIKNLAAASADATTGYNFHYEVKVVSESGEPRVYSLDLSRGPMNLSDSNEFNAITVVDSNNVKYLGGDNTYREVFNPDTKTYEYTIPYGTQSVTIDIERDKYVTAQKIGAQQITVLDSMLGNSYPYEVYQRSESGIDSEKYTIRLTFEKADDNVYLIDFKLGIGNDSLVSIQNFDKTINRYVYPTVLPYSVSEVSFVGTPESNLSTVSPNKIATQDLDVGSNIISITVTAQDGRSHNTYTVSITRDYPEAYLKNLGVDGEQLLNALDKETTFNKEVTEYHVIVPYTTFMGSITAEVEDANYRTTCSNSTENPTGLSRTFNNLAFAEGDNEFKITATSPEGKQKTYIVVVNRLSEKTADATISGINIDVKNGDGRSDKAALEEYLSEQPLAEQDNITEFQATEFNSTAKSTINVKVPNSTTKLEFNVTPNIADNPSTAQLEGATWEVIGNELHSGDNKVVLLVTAEDGVTTRSFIYNVYREPMSYRLDDTQQKIKFTDDEKITNLSDSSKLRTVTLDIPNKDYTNPNYDFEKLADYIVYDDEMNNITVTMVHDNTFKKNENEIVFKVTDGDETDFVIFKLNIVKEGLDFVVTDKNKDIKIESQEKTVFGTSNVRMVKLDLDADKKADFDFKSYIEVLSGENVTIEEVNDLSFGLGDDQVVYRVTNGETEEYVFFKLNSTNIPSSVVGALKVYWPLILGIILSIIILLMILITVNKDKYGKINRKRKAE